MNKYDPKQIEKKWQDKWFQDKDYAAKDDSKDKTYYCLVEFPFPSGDGLHVGHVRSYTALDVIARKRRAEGYNVLYPMGWDAFGLPTENYAIKTGIHPREATKKNTDNFRRQLQSMGFSFDWDREVNTTDPDYFKWTQWIFLQMYKSGLAYKDNIPINWCLSCKIGLANEEVLEGRCERCGGEIEKRNKEQWMLAITKYADRLHDDLDKVDYREDIKAQQRAWIGRSEGAEIDFPIEGGEEKIKIFTTRADTLFGATYIVLSPEHELIQSFGSQIENIDEVREYVKNSSRKTEIERTSDTKEKTGVELKGIRAINPINNESIPIFIADYVLSGYGTGAIMAVPAHDTRDKEFALKYNLQIKEVVIPNIVDKRNPPISGKENVERRNIHALVRNPKTGEYLGLKWKKFDWLTFPMGGIEDGEDPEEAARREVLEETGYKNIKLVKVLEGRARAEYFAAHKDQNRISYTNAVLFDLVNEERVEVSEKEKELHEVVWLEKEKLNYTDMTHSEIEHWLEIMNNKNFTYTKDGHLVDSGDFSGLESKEAAKRITEKVGGEFKTTYKLRDWVFSRQRYWGEPIPMIHCSKCGIVPVPEEDLPVTLPEVEKYEPRDDGESPLASVEDWVNVKCPTCSGDAKRETDVMPNWAGSSWYFLRYIDPKNDKEFADKKKLTEWMPVDWYNGGMEHTTLHLLYSRFWNKFLFDEGFVTESEPYAKRSSHGMILAEGGVKMSKSKGNVVNPDDIVQNFGADTLRLYELFIGPFEQAVAWSEEALVGPRRFIEKVWNLQERVREGDDTDSQHASLVHKTIKKVTEDIENMGFNTAVSQMMILVNAFEKEEAIPHKEYVSLLRLLAPFAPHVTEEVWSNLGHENSIHREPWPTYDPNLVRDEIVSLGVQVNGKVRDSVDVSLEMSEDEVREMVLNREDVQKWLEGNEPKKFIYVKGKIISIVV